MEQLFGKTIPSAINYPFDATCIESISLRCDRSIIDRGFIFNGYVEFKNGKTEGKQKFTASNLGELYIKIAEFCESLK
jgi:hypothetical protein